MEKKSSFGKIVLFFIIFILIVGGILIVKQADIQWLPEKVNTEETSAIVENVISQSNIKNQIENVQTNIAEPVLKVENNSSYVTEVNTVQQTNGYFYSQLGEEAKIIYNAIESHKEEMKTGNYSIDLGNTFQKLLEQENGSEKLEQAYQDAWDAINTDYVDFFYIDSSKVYLYTQQTKIWNYSTYTVTIGPVENSNYYAQGFTSKQMIEQTLAQLENSRQNIIMQLTGDTYQKIAQINAYLVDNISYDETLNRPNTRNIYGAVIEKQVVCEGYAKALKYILDELEIPCVLVSGTATNSDGNTETHLWNYVQIEQNWYAVDVTWNDPVIIGGGRQTNAMKTAYLCKGQTTMQKDHMPNGKISQKGMTFSYPVLSQKDY